MSSNIGKLKNKRVKKAIEKNKDLSSELSDSSNLRKEDKKISSKIGNQQSKTQSPYQFNGFLKKYGEVEDNQAIKNMSYLQKKIILAKDFGVIKSHRAMQTLITNKVEDDGVINKEGYGARDKSIFAMALQMQNKIQNQKNQRDLTQKQLQISTYSRQGLLPEQILDQICYKPVFEALQSQDDQKFKGVLSNFTKISLINAYENFENMDSKKEKKFLMRAHIYLDALISLYRMPAQIQKSLDQIQKSNFKLLDIPVIEQILEKFTQVQSNNPNLSKFKKAEKKEEVNLFEDNNNQLVKYVKTKELQKVLICNIIGVAIQLARGNKVRGSLFASILKKDLSDLKNYFKEVGLIFEPFKNEKSKEADLMIFLKNSKSKSHDNQEQISGEIPAQPQKRERSKSQ